MRIVIALGGNALLKRGEPMHYEVQQTNVRMACQQIAKVLPGNELIITHGNGPQVGLIALQQNAYPNVPMYPLDAIGAESVGMIGYMIARELTNVVSQSIAVTNVLTQTEIDPNDPAFKHPTKPIGPIYTKEEAETLSQTHGWTMASDNDKFRRVVASPNPQRILGLSTLKTLIENGHLVVCCGGGGVPVYFDQKGQLIGAEAVIDKDLASSLLAISVNADLFVIATDVDGVYTDWGKPSQSLIRQIDAISLRKLTFARGSMAPKVEATCRFVEKTGKAAIIGALDQIEKIIDGEKGTQIHS